MAALLHMNGPIAQFVALTCHANAFLRGLRIPEFFPANSTCRFCDWVKFFNVTRTLLGKARLVEVAANPDGWFECLKAEDVSEIRLSRTPQDDPGIPDRMSAAFVGGGGTWTLKATDRKGQTAVWLSKWEVWNQDPPERRIWRVSYGRFPELRSRSDPFIDLDGAVARLRGALQDIYTFSERHDCGGFTISFARALQTLDSRGSILHGYHHDLAPEGCLPPLAGRMLDACQTAWVFGGMGSWSDLGFAGSDRAGYDRVSDRLFAALNEAIYAGANSSCASRTNCPSAASTQRYSLRE
jgi:hypothetical protein